MLIERPKSENVIYKNLEKPSCQQSGSIVKSNNCVFGPGVIVDGCLENYNEPSITIEEGVFIGSYSCIRARRGRIFLGRNVKIGHNCYIEAIEGDIIITDNSIIGNDNIIKVNNSTIYIDSSTIGDFCLFDCDGGKISIGNETIIQDYVKMYSENGEINISQNAKIDSCNELRGKGSIFIGSKSHLWSGSYISAFEAPFHLAFRVTIGQKCILAGRGEISIGELSMIGGSCYIVSENHSHFHPFISIRDQGFTHQGVTIGQDSWIGANCTILNGVEIGYRSMVGAGSVVTKNIPPYKLSIGSPSCIIRDRRQFFAEALIFLYSHPDDFETAVKISKIGRHSFYSWLQEHTEEDFVAMMNYFKEQEKLADENIAYIMQFIKSFQNCTIQPVCSTNKL